MFNFYLPLLLYPIGCLVIYYLSGYYLRPLRKRYSREFRRTFVSSLLITLGAFFIIIMDDPVDNYQRYLTSLLVLFAIQFVGSYLPRLLVTYLSHKLDSDTPRAKLFQNEITTIPKNTTIERYCKGLLSALATLGA